MPLGHRFSLSHFRALAILAFLRYRFPRTPLRVTKGRELSLRTFQPLAILVGTSIFVGVCLTTPDQAPRVAYLKEKPVTIERGEGVKLFDVDGRAYLDGYSSLLSLVPLRKLCYNRGSARNGGADGGHVR